MSETQLLSKKRTLRIHESKKGLKNEVLGRATTQLGSGTIKSKAGNVLERRFCLISRLFSVDSFIFFYSRLALLR